MFRFFRSAQVAPGQGEAAMQFSKAVADYITEHYTEVHVGFEVAGQVGRVYWFSDHVTIQDWDDLGTKLTEDEEYGKIVASSADMFMGGETVDTLVRMF